MEDGKSQTWIAYASSLADEYNIDYIVKQDSDSMLILDKFFEFIDGSLPASPYNHHTFPSIMLMCQPNHNKDCSGYKKKFEGPSSMVFLHYYCCFQANSIKIRGNFWNLHPWITIITDFNHGWLLSSGYFPAIYFLSKFFNFCWRPFATSPVVHITKETTILSRTLELQ